MAPDPKLAIALKMNGQVKKNRVYIAPERKLDPPSESQPSRIPSKKGSVSAIFSGVNTVVAYLYQRTKNGMRLLVPRLHRFIQAMMTYDNGMV